MAGEVERAALFGPEPVAFGATFVKSDAFRELFRDGMALVEQTAAYLDGEGRTQSAGLSRTAALTYASESMRLTTRLMQIASWLLVQRAVAENEITPAQAQREKERVKLVRQEPANEDVHFTTLPDEIRDLVAQSLRMHARIMHLDRLIAGVAEVAPTRPSPVAMQQGLLRKIYEIG